jgi:hypothetical protein
MCKIIFFSHSLTICSPNCTLSAHAPRSQLEHRASTEADMDTLKFKLVQLEEARSEADQRASRLERQLETARSAVRFVSAPLGCLVFVFNVAL